MSNIPKTLEGFLSLYKSTKENGFTHTKIGHPKLGIYGGAYNIPDEKIELFYNLYMKDVIVKNKQSYLTEVQLPDKGPLLVDIDERYSIGVEERQHTHEHIIDLISLYVEKLQDMLEINDDAKFSIPVYVMEKDEINKVEGYVKDGIHLIFGITLSHTSQMILRDKIIEEIGDIFEDLPLTNTYTELIDVGIARGKTNWQLFGSQKPNNEPYKITKLYNVYLDEEGECAFDCKSTPNMNLEIVKELSARNTSHVEYELNEETKKAANLRKQTIRVKKKATITVSNSSLNTIVACINSFEHIQNEEQCQAVMDKILELSEAQDSYDVIMAYKMAMVLNDKYYIPFEEWMKIGWTLKAISPLLYPAWLLFSAKSDKFDWSDNECYNLWNEHGGNGSLTMGSLRYWARDCDEMAYNEIYKNSVDYYLYRTLDGETEYDVARLVFTIYEGQYKCCNIRNKLWYEYKKGRWSEIDSGTTLRNALSSRISKIYHIKVKDTLSSLDDNGPASDADSEAVKSMRMNADQLSKMALKLKKTAWKQNIMRECCEVFFDKNFMNLLDTNTELLCFKNGVLDIRHKIFREGRPDDYTSLCTDTDYTPIDNTNIDHVRIKEEIITFMKQLFPNPNVNKYMWEHLASVLRGDNRNQTFNIYTGCGRNGKSKLVELMSLVLGDYKGSVPLALITQKRGNIGGVSPEIAQLKGLRYAVMQEPSKGTKLNEGVMKELTGGDPLQGRALFKDTVTFTPQFSLVVCTNHLFEIDSCDDGTWRRIRVCDFPGKFVDDPSKNPEDYEFKIDRNIDEKFKEWVPIFTAMLVETLFETDGIVGDCPEVMSSSQNYKAQQDYFTGFMKERIVKLESGKIRKTDVLHEFQEWYAELYGGKVPSGKELYEFLEKKLGKPTPSGWKGWNLYHSYDLVDDDEIAPNGI